MCSYPKLWGKTKAWPMAKAGSPWRALGSCSRSFSKVSFNISRSGSLVMTMGVARVGRVSRITTNFRFQIQHMPARSFYMLFADLLKLMDVQFENWTSWACPGRSCWAWPWRGWNHLTSEAWLIALLPQLRFWLDVAWPVFGEKKCQWCQFTENLTNLAFSAIPHHFFFF